MTNLTTPRRPLQHYANAMLSQRLLPRAPARLLQRPQTSLFRLPARTRQFHAKQRLRSDRYPEPPLVGDADNAFNRERAAVRAHAAHSTDLWRKLSIYVAIPCLIFATINAWNLWNEHWNHWDHEPPLEERVQYDYQNIRTKKFFWGDGDKTLFWNPKVNYHKKDE